jgi:hypothetical protein
MSFGWTGFFRQGAWREFRSFILNQKRDSLPRLRAINAEINRIGNLRLTYSRIDPSDPTSPVSENRTGIEVSSGSALEKLLQAYIAQGGNPFDISMFLHFDSFEVVENEEGDPTVLESEPYGGVIYPQSVDPVAGGLYTGGWLPIWRYPPRKFGNNITYVGESSEMTPAIRQARDWANREIRHLRNNIEARIIKLCDLREQLVKERDEILPQAIGDAAYGISFDPDAFAVTHHTSNIIKLIDDVFYPDKLDNGYYDFEHPRTSEPNPSYAVLLEDAPTGEEDWTAFG